MAEELRVHPKACQYYIREKVNASGNFNNTGHWTRKEIKRFLKAIMQTLEIDDLKKCLGKKLSWTAISKLVGTRSEQGCKTYFETRLLWKIGNCEDIDTILTYSTKKKRIDEKVILHFMNTENERSEEAVDWNLLQTKLPHLSLRKILQTWDQMKEEIPAESRVHHRLAVKYLMQSVNP
jgi:hypothetical protein